MSGRKVLENDDLCNYDNDLGSFTKQLLEDNRFDTNDPMKVAMMYYNCFIEYRQLLFWVLMKFDDKAREVEL